MLRTTVSLVLLARSSATVLIMGDSLLEFSGRAISEFCAGQSYVNMAIGGTNSSQWGAPGGGSKEPQHCEDLPHKPCRPDAGFSLKPVIPYTHVWFSIGSNDWMGRHCRPTELEWADLGLNVGNALSNIVAAAPPDVPIIMTRYPKPGMRPNECVKKDLVPRDCTLGCGALGNCAGCTLKECPGCRLEPMSFEEMMTTHDQMNAVVETACRGHTSGRCSFINLPPFPPSNTPRSLLNATAPDAFDSCVYHRDGLHLNNNGFCHMLTHESVQAAFGCQPAVYDCDQVGKTIPGSPKLTKIEGQCVDYVPDPLAVDPSGNQTATKHDFHFQIDSLYATSATKAAIAQAETVAVAGVASGVMGAALGAVDQTQVMGAEMKRQMTGGKSPFFEAAAGMSLRGLFDVDEQKRYELWPGFVAYRQSLPQQYAWKKPISRGLPSQNTPFAASFNTLQALLPRSAP